MPSQQVEVLRGVGDRMQRDGFDHSAEIILQAATRMAELEKIVVRTYAMKGHWVKHLNDLLVAHQKAMSHIPHGLVTPELRDIRERAREAAMHITDWPNSVLGLLEEDDDPR